MCKILRDLTEKSVNTNVQVKSKNGPALLTEAEQSEGWIENLRDVRSRNCKWKPKHPYIYRHWKTVSAAWKSSRTNVLETYVEKLSLRISEKKNKIQKTGWLADDCEIMVERTNTVR